MWRFVAYGAFLLATLLTAWGLWRMNINETYEASLLVSWLCLTTSTFSVVKPFAMPTTQTAPQWIVEISTPFRMSLRTKKIVFPLISITVALAMATTANFATAQNRRRDAASEACALSALRIASVIIVGGAASAVVVVLPVALSTTGAVLSMAGEAIAVVPNEIGHTLLHNERITH